VSLSTVDRLDILELLARVDDAATRRDVAAYVDLFSELGVLDGEMGEHHGRQALAEAVRSVWAAEGPASVHLTLNPVVEAVPGDPDHAVARSMMLVVGPGPPPTLDSVSAIVQRVERTSLGWRVARRTVAPGGP
jgi:hypothetical protein